MKLPLQKLLLPKTGNAWPTPGYTKITSTFGYRQSPTGRNGNFHSGLDIGAPTGAYLVAIFDGIVVSTGWSGSGGYAIIIERDNLRISYCHTSSNYYVSKGDFVKSGQVIRSSRFKICL